MVFCPCLTFSFFVFCSMYKFPNFPSLWETSPPWVCACLIMCLWGVASVKFGQVRVVNVVIVCTSSALQVISVANRLALVVAGYFVYQAFHIWRYWLTIKWTDIWHRSDLTELWGIYDRLRLRLDTTAELFCWLLWSLDRYNLRHPIDFRGYKIREENGRNLWLCKNDGVVKTFYGRECL